MSEEIHQPTRTATTPALYAEHLSRKEGDIYIVEDVSVEVWGGDFLAVIGPSGSGKSSFLRLLNRLDEPTEGTVYLGGRDYRGIPPRELRRRVGVVLQQPFLFPGTVSENVAFGPTERGEPVAEDLVGGLLGRVGLSGYEGRNVSRLSGGEAQRVSLARTLANSPEVLLLDEPTSALDEEAEAEVEELVCGILAERNLTGVIVTHDSEQAARMASRVMVMERGRVVRVGTVEEVLNA